MLTAVPPRQSLPSSLESLTAGQHYDTYTASDQQTWQAVLLRLIPFSQEHAHPFFLEGLEKTGIGPNRIPHICEIDNRLHDYGWGAVPVAGFIPPAAFMEFHAQGILPISREIRKPENLEYTPAPDIIHE